MENLDNLITESQNENSKNIDSLSTIEMVNIINSEDAKIAEAIKKENINLAKAIDEISKRYINGGSIDARWSIERYSMTGNLTIS